MEPNVGETDRTLRLAAGMLLGILGAIGALGQATFSPLIGVLLLVVGLVLLGTGLTRSCLLYRPLGIDTRSKR
ncbi:MAG: YgaP family membrane protein [Halobacteriota archaeon]